MQPACWWPDGEWCIGARLPADVIEGRSFLPGDLVAFVAVRIGWATVLQSLRMVTRGTFGQDLDLNGEPRDYDISVDYFIQHCGSAALKMQRCTNFATDSVIFSEFFAGRVVCWSAQVINDPELSRNGRASVRVSVNSGARHISDNFELSFKGHTLGVAQRLRTGIQIWFTGRLSSQGCVRYDYSPHVIDVESVLEMSDYDAVSSNSSQQQRPPNDRGYCSEEGLRALRARIPQDTVTSEEEHLSTVQTPLSSQADTVLQQHGAPHGNHMCKRGAVDSRTSRRTLSNSLVPTSPMVITSPVGSRLPDAPDLAVLAAIAPSVASDVELDCAPASVAPGILSETGNIEPASPTVIVDSRAAHQWKVEEPSDLLCPVVGCIFRDPVVNVFGNTYERKALERFWQSAGNANKDPLTNQVLESALPIPSDLLIPNWDVRRRVRAFIDAHPGYVPDGWPDRDVPPPQQAVSCHSVGIPFRDGGQFMRFARRILVSAGVLLILCASTASVSAACRALGPMLSCALDFFFRPSTLCGLVACASRCIVRNSEWGRANAQRLCDLDVVLLPLGVLAPAFGLMQILGF